MSKKENEAVVNRFLLSTVYIIIFEMFLYFMYKLACGGFGFAAVNFVNEIHWCIIVSGIALAIYFGIRFFVMKKGNLYHFVIFLVLGLTGLFLEYAWTFSEFFGASVSRRYTLLSLVYLMFYVYEIIVYFLRVNK